MKKKVKIAVVLIMVLLLAVWIGDHKYRQAMENIQIVFTHYAQTAPNEFYSVRIFAIVPENEYSEDQTMNLIRFYVIRQCLDVPRKITITLYDSQQAYENHESYASTSFYR